MRIDHIAIWTSDLERMKDYYVRHFGAAANELYSNPATAFKSYFLSFSSGARIEIMHRDDIPDNNNDPVNAQHKGLIHLAFSVGTMEEVEEKARELADAGFRILRGPRKTGDGCYEFETLDPENNRLEVMTEYKEQR